MINLYKQDLLKQLSKDDYELWCHDLAVIKRVVTAIASSKSFKYIFDCRKYYYIPDYAQDTAGLRYVDAFMPYSDLRGLANDFLYSISVVRGVEQYYPLEYYPLHLRVFIDCAEEDHLTRTHYDPANISSTFANRLNNCAYDIYQQMKCLENRAEIKRAKALSSRQKCSAENYIDQLVLRYSRLIAIRIDFGYREDAEVSYELISEHREVLLRYLREKHLGNAFAGYIWKLEYGLKKGYHLHMMIFLDGSQVQESVSHGKIIANHWVTEITEREGTAFNCNAGMESYRYKGIGRVDYHDFHKVGNLKYACRYLTKYDEFLELVHYGYQVNQNCSDVDDPVRQAIFSKLGRVFGTARLPQYIPQLGRPRSK